MGSCDGNNKVTCLLASKVEPEGTVGPSWCRLYACPQLAWPYQQAQRLSEGVPSRGQLRAPVTGQECPRGVGRRACKEAQMPGGAPDSIGTPGH